MKLHQLYLLMNSWFGPQQPGLEFLIQKKRRKTWIGIFGEEYCLSIDESLDQLVIIIDLFIYFLNKKHKTIHSKTDQIT